MGMVNTNHIRFGYRLVASNVRSLAEGFIATGGLYEYDGRVEISQLRVYPQSGIFCGVALAFRA
jgi:hypothetical protein